jgi:serine/threonine protein kinase/Flp pilus assembly protein TadD
MSQRDLSQVESIFHAVLERPREDREAYLQSACKGDQSLYADVFSLISALDSNDKVFEQPALSLGLRVLSQSSKVSLIGTSLGPYKIVSNLGKGGMGEVYLAEDTKLGRKVAVKFLSLEFVGENSAKRQLMKEAQAVAQLDHPNICLVYGFEEYDAYCFIVMQYVCGETLASLIPAENPKIETVVDLAVQMVGAIAEAHAHSIIHRDIKPGNIMVTKSGQLKVLDFGLAKVIQRKQHLDAGVESISQFSDSEVLQGTVAYMSPEQLRGEKLDYRSDLFSVGTVLYEMLAGVNPWLLRNKECLDDSSTRNNKLEVISSILSARPIPLRQLSLPVSADLDRIVQRCLEKNKEARFQSANELLIKLQAIQTSNPSRINWRSFVNVRNAAALFVLLLVISISAYVYLQLSRVRTVAVLPIKNESGLEFDYLADGFTESLTGKLSGLSRLRVKPQSLVHGYKGQNVAPAKVAQDIGADGILVGKITGGAELPVLQVSLIASDGSVLWENQYSIDLEKVFQIESEIAQRVAHKFELRSSEDQKRIQAARDPENAEARKEYWLGKYYWGLRDNDGQLDLAIQHFNEAIKLAPTYAKAHAGLSDCYVYASSPAYGKMSTRAAMTQAEKAARNAIELDPSLPDPHSALGTLNFKYYWNWQEAETRFKRAIELQQDNFQAHYSYSNLLMVLGRGEEAIVESKIARDLDPFSPVAALNVCRAQLFARKVDEARSCYEKIFADYPNFKAGRYSRSLQFLRDHKYRDAIEILEEIYVKDRRLGGGLLGYAYAVSGRTKDAERILSELQAIRPNPDGTGGIASQELAFIYIGMGKMKEAIDLLERSAVEHYPPFAYLPLDPLFPDLQADPRFIELAKRFNLPAPLAAKNQP